MSKPVKAVRVKLKKISYTIDPEQGSMFLASSAPTGYKIKSINRKGSIAKVTYQRV